MLTSHVARQYRLQQWADSIRECQSSALPVSVWCKQNQITESTYYYRLRVVREAMLLSEGKQEIVAIPNTLAESPTAQEVTVVAMGELQISIGNRTVHVNAATPPSLLKMVLEVIDHA